MRRVNQKVRPQSGALAPPSKPLSPGVDDPVLKHGPLSIWWLRATRLEGHDVDRRDH